MDHEKAREELVNKYRTLATAAKEKGVDLTVIRNLFGPSSVKVSKKRRLLKRNVFFVVFIIGVISSFAAFFFKDALKETLDIGSFRCLIENNELTIEMARPLTSCDFCKNLKSVPVEHDISAQEFKRKYAYNLVPVLIKDATSHWSAMSKFSFKFFKDLYTEKEGALDSVDEQCQFFPYKTDFSNLNDVFNMSDTRANFSEGEEPWYIGW